MIDSNVEISIKGRWVKVPALDVGGKSIIVTGTWLKMASVCEEEWLETELADPQACVAELKDKGSHRICADILTFSQKLPPASPKYTYHVELDSVAAVRTTCFMDWWEKLSQETRKNVRRSQRRGVQITIESFGDNLVRGIMAVNNESPTRQGAPNAHYGKTFDQVKRDYSSFLDRSDFICARFENELIGFLKVVYRGDIASILNLTAKASHYEKRPTNALVSKAVALCEEKGISYLTYGMLNYGNKRHGTLRQFKIRNGFEEVLTPRYFVPLTRWGALVIELKLHRGVIGILPDEALRVGLRARAKLYNLRQSLSRCSSVAERPKSNRQMERSIPPAGSNL